MGKEWMRPEDFHQKRDQLEEELDLSLQKAEKGFFVLKTDDTAKYGVSVPHQYLIREIDGLRDDLHKLRLDINVLRQELSDTMHHGDGKPAQGFLQARKKLTQDTLATADIFKHILTANRKLGDIYESSATTLGDVNGSWGIFNAALQHAAEYFDKVIDADKNEVSF